MWVKLRRYFLSGLVVLLPLALTIYLFVLAMDFADGLMGKFIQPIIREKLRFYVPGLGIILGVILIVLVGFFATNFFGKKIHAAFENVLVRLPFFRQVYPAIKEMAMFLFSRDKLRFKQVVLIEYPRKGLFSIGFLTNETHPKFCEMTKKKLRNVFLPSAPGPLTGYIIMVPEDDIHYTNVPVEEAFKFILSGGVVNPLIPPQS